ncbi:uncharacterized protein si:busm1-163l24.3 [Pangasianodon hypophthalmus]|uniref:uncharacterized protein si:busm1-163l24.3 n=1 Tax=Pangasianodon hypophthalmus TaxID=310915 RepID=UPI000EFF0963|nr:uncharacterized protein si:busm1-163l24.3 [Pangasianodon hypophthalmus]
MAEMGHTVCVRGLPADLEHERLQDKLLIHFLRERNGGGEISSITIKAKDPCAIIAFEDNRVALSVCNHRPHVLEVDGRMYELSVSFPWQETLHLNKVILDMSVTIDCNHLPLGEETIKTLTERFPGLGINYIKPQRHCTLKGPFSEVNDVVSHLIELLADFEPPSEESLLFARESDRVHLHQKGKDNPPDQPRGLHFGEDVSLHQESRYPSSKVNSVKLLQAQKCSDEKIKDWVDAVDDEALSLIMEADVFAYLCSRSEEYRNILQNHGVHVVDVTSAGVTTLYLQSNAKVKTGSKAAQHMNHARKELSQLYQQVEGNLRRAQIPRSALNLHGEQTAAFKDLESLLPKVLLSFDQTHVYIVGESSEVSQAKQILLFGSPDENLRAKQEISLSSFRSYSPISESETMQMTGASSESSTMTPKMRISAAEKRVRTGEEYKLAARFKNSDMGLLGFGPVERGRTRERQDLTKGINMLTLVSNSGPNLSTDLSLGTAGTVNSDQARASQVSAIKVTSANNVDDDILFQKMEPLSFTGTLKNSGQVSNKVNRTHSVSCTSRVTPAFKAPISTVVDALTGLEKPGKTTGYTVESTTTSNSSLRRANSFSGQPLQKQETQKINEKTCLATNSFRRPRSSSLNSRMSAEALPSSTVSKTVTVPTLMWSYIKEAYHSDLNSLISDLQVSENHIEKYKTMVVLKGSASSKVEECQHELHKLVDVIGLDFCVQSLQLADLGVTEGNDTFKECCLNICSHFSRIVLQHVKDGIFLMGPKSLCSQASEMLKELFPNGFSNSGSLVNTFTHHGSTDESQANASANQMAVKSNSQIRPNQAKSNSDRPAKGRLKGYKSESWNAAYMQSPKPVAKEILKKASDVEISKTAPLPGSGVQLGLKDDWQKPSSLTAQKNQKETTLTLKQTNLPIIKQLGSCVCGENGAQTSCGVFLCSNCIPLHAQCIVCSKMNAARKPSKEIQVHPHKEEQNTEELKGKEAGTRQKQEQGIQGTMRCTELSVSLPGYEQYRTAKITYSIPDGIQGEEHPNPGLPFQGGVFEAYLPLSSKGQGLLQCLEKAFKQGFTFTVCPSNNIGKAKITWSRIPHKTKITGGKSGNGYPDSTYLKDLSEALRTCGIEGV